MRLAMILTATILVPACVAEDPEVVSVAESELRSSSLVLTSEGCVEYQKLDVAARRDVDGANAIGAMTPRKRREAGVIMNPTLSPALLASYQELHASPCYVEAEEWTCVSHSGPGLHHWAMCTNGTITCGVGTDGVSLVPTAWCR